MEYTIILLIIALIFIVAVSTYHKYEVFAPWTVTPAVWGVIFILYLFSKNDLYTLPADVVSGLAIWNGLFCLSCFVAFKLTPRYQGTPWTVCDRNVNILLALSVILVPFAVVKAIQYALLIGSPADLFFTLREQAVTPEENQMGMAKYFIYVINVLLMIELDREVLRKKKILAIAFLCLLFFLATMSKHTLFTFIFSGLYILYHKKRISLKPFAFFIAFLLALVPIMYFVRGGEDGDTSLTVWDLMIIYITSPLVAFGYIMPGSSAQWGEETFRGAYNILDKMGFDVTVPNLIQDFVATPLPSNTYTVLQPFYADFGLTGIAVFAIMEGIIIGIAYKLSQTGNNLMKYLYAFIFTTLVMQFVEEQFFIGISSMIQTTLLILICHISFTYRNDKQTV